MSAEAMEWNVEVFTAGKRQDRNEDQYGFDSVTLALSDGATDKTGIDYNGMTGGEVAARTVVETCMSSRHNGPQLVDEVTAALRQRYAELNPDALHNSAARAAATLLIARIVGHEVVVTRVGDSNFRINGSETYLNDKLVDTENARLRSQHIQATGDVPGGREVIMPRLRTQHEHQNNPDSEYGYGVIDGTDVPEAFVQTFRFPVASLRLIELVTDGYYGVFPDEPTLDGYEAVRRQIEADDPHKYLTVLSTKENDDRTVMIGQLIQR